MGGTGNHKSSRPSWTFINPEMNPTDLLSWHPQELQQLFCLDQPITHFLGVPIDGQTAFRNETTNNAQVKTRLDGVEYIFLDEVSMVACNDNYKISSQLAKALNEI